MSESKPLWNNISEQNHKVAEIALEQIRATYDLRLIKFKKQPKEFFEP
jgi:hypothetical protein